MTKRGGLSMLTDDVQQQIIDLWFKFETSVIDEIDFSVAVSEILKPILWDEMKEEDSR